MSSEPGLICALASCVVSVAMDMDLPPRIISINSCGVQHVIVDEFVLKRCGCPSVQAATRIIELVVYTGSPNILLIPNHAHQIL